MKNTALCYFSRIRTKGVLNASQIKKKNSTNGKRKRSSAI